MTDFVDLQRIIRLPRVTEASTEDQEKNNSYHFAVHPKANKIEIRNAVEKLFNVKVLSVRTMNRAGKVKRKYVARRGWQLWGEPDWKKAVVTLKPGDAINFQ